MDSQKQLDLGHWLGLQKAFANSSSGCSASPKIPARQHATLQSNLMSSFRQTKWQIFLRQTDAFGRLQPANRAFICQEWKRLPARRRANENQPQPAASAESASTERRSDPLEPARCRNA